MKQRVIVIGNSYATRLGVIRSVGQIGCDVVVIHIGNFHTTRPEKPIDGYSKYVSQIIFFNRKEREEGLVKLLLEQCVVDGEKAVIIPTNDYSALVIDNEEIKKHFLVPFIKNDMNSIYYWMNKANQKRLAIKAGLNVAGFCVVNRDESAFVVPNEVQYPCFVKPLSSIGGGKKCLRRCGNISELQEILGIAEKNNIEQLLVEDYLDIEEEYAVLGFSDGNEVIIPGVILFVRECQSHKGVAMVGEVLPADGFKEIIEKFSFFIRNIGLVGLFDIDFFKCQGEFFFGELNVRIGASGTVITKMGVNLPAMFVKTLLGGGIGDEKHVITTSATFVNERMCIDDWFAGNISTLRLHHIINSADIQFVKDVMDTRPYKELLREIQRNLFSYKRLFKRLSNIFR